MGNKTSGLIHAPKDRRSIKCYIAVNRHLQQALLDVVHDPQYDGLPKDPEELYKFFNKQDNIKKINNLRKKKILKQDQIDLLLPQNQRTFSNKWDVTLISVVIINFTKLPEPINGWRGELDPTDISIAAFLVQARQLRNRSNHATLETFCEEVDFKPFFTETRLIIVGLKYKDITQFDQLADESIDPTLFKEDIKLFMKNIATIKEKENVISEVLDWLKKDNEKGIFQNYIFPLFPFFCLSDSDTLTSILTFCMYLFVLNVGVLFCVSPLYMLLRN